MFGFVGTLLIAALVLFGLFRRLTRGRRRQPVRPRRMLITIALMCLIGVGLPARLPGDFPMYLFGALAIGVGLAALALARTRFEREADGAFFTHGSHIGLVVFALLTACMLWRAGEGLAVGQPMWDRRLVDPDSGIGPINRTLTLTMLYVMIGYSVAYMATILLRSRGVAPAAPAAPAQER